MPSNVNLYNNISLKPPYSPRTVGTKMYKGFSTVSADTNNFKLYDFQLIKQDILNMFYTRQGERLMNPKFGCVIWELLFEPLTEELKYIIKNNVEAIVNYDPRVKASQIAITPYDTGIQLEITLEYVSYNLSDLMKVQFDQSNNLILG